MIIIMRGENYNLTINKLDKKFFKCGTVKTKEKRNFKK